MPPTVRCQHNRIIFAVVFVVLYILSLRAQGPDWSGAGLHQQSAHAGHQHSIMLFTARLQQRRPLPTKNRTANLQPCILCRRNSWMESPTD